MNDNHIVLNTISMNTFFLNLVHDWHHDTCIRGSLGRDRWTKISTKLNELVKFIEGNKDDVEMQEQSEAQAEAEAEEEAKNMPELISEPETQTHVQSEVKNNPEKEEEMSQTGGNDFKKNMIDILNKIKYYNPFAQNKSKEDLYEDLYNKIKQSIKSQLLQLNIVKKMGGMPATKKNRKIENKYPTKLMIKLKPYTRKNDNNYFAPISLKKNVYFNTINLFNNILKSWVINNNNTIINSGLNENTFIIVQSNLQEIDDLINEIVESLIITFFNIYIDLIRPDYENTIDYLIDLIDEPDGNVLYLNQNQLQMRGGASIGNIDNIKKLEGDIILTVERYKTLWFNAIEENKKIVNDKRKQLKDAYKINKEAFYKDIISIIKEYDNINICMSVIKNAWTFMMPTEDIKIEAMFKNIKETLLREIYRNKIVKQIIEQHKKTQEEEKKQDQLSSGEIGSVHGTHTDALTTIFIKNMMRMTGLIVDDEEIIPFPQNTNINELKILVGQIAILCMIGNIEYEPSNKSDIYRTFGIQNQNQNTTFIKTIKQYFGFGGRDGYDDNLITLFQNVYGNAFQNNLSTNPSVVISNASTTLNSIPVNKTFRDFNGILQCCIDSIKDAQPSCSAETSRDNFFGMAPREYVITDNVRRYKSALYMERESESKMNIHSYDSWKRTNFNLTTEIFMNGFNPNVNNTTFNINDVSKTLSAKNIMKEVIIYCLDFYEKNTQNVKTNGYWSFFESNNNNINELFLIAHKKCKGDLDQELFALTKNGGAIQNSNTVYYQNNQYNPNILEITIDRPSFCRMALLRLSSDQSTINNQAACGIMTGTNVMFINPATPTPTQIRGGTKKKYVNKHKRKHTRKHIRKHIRKNKTNVKIK